jgi:hypothetical protein
MGGNKPTSHCFFQGFPSMNKPHSFFPPIDIELILPKCRRFGEFNRYQINLFLLKVVLSLKDHLPLPLPFKVLFSIVISLEYRHIPLYGSQIPIKLIASWALGSLFFFDILLHWDASSTTTPSSSAFYGMQSAPSKAICVSMVFIITTPL